jgi:hypothetical protein
MPDRIVLHETGAVREQFPFDHASVYAGALRRLAARCRFGAEKYGDGLNYRKGLPISDTYSHAMQHLLRWRESELSGVPSDEDELAAAMWGIMVLMFEEDVRYGATKRNNLDPESAGLGPAEVPRSPSARDPRSCR